MTNQELIIEFTQNQDHYDSLGRLRKIPRTEKARSKKSKDYLNYIDTLFERTSFLPNRFNLTPRIKALQEKIDCKSFLCPVCGKDRHYRTGEAIFSLTCDKKDQAHNNYIQEKRRKLYVKNSDGIDPGQRHYNLENLKKLDKKYFLENFITKEGYVKSEEFSEFLGCSYLKAFKFCKKYKIDYNHRPRGGFDPKLPGYVYYIKDVFNNLYKVGITNLKVTKRFAGKLKKINIIETWHFENGQDAIDREKEIHKEYAIFRVTNEDFTNNGATEFFSRDILGLDSNR